MTYGFITFLIKRCIFIDVLFACDEFLSSMNSEKENAHLSQIWEEIELSCNKCALKEFEFLPVRQRRPESKVKLATRRKTASFFRIRISTVKTG